MPKEKTAGQSKLNWATPKFKGKTVAFTGGSLRDWKRAVEFVDAEGGRVAEDVTADVDYLVVSVLTTKRSTQAQQKALRLNQKQGAAIQIISESDFYELFKPTLEEAMAMLWGGEKGRKRWNRLAPCWERAGKLTLTGTDWRGADLREVDLSGVQLEGITFANAQLRKVRIEGAKNCTFNGAQMAEANISDCTKCSFRHADLREAMISRMKRCTFDGARITRGNFWNCADCSAKKVDLSETRLNPSDISRSDFTGAKMSVMFSSYTVARDTVFRNADLSGAELDESIFERADFTGADLSGADLHKSNFTEAILSRAKLARADLRAAKLVKVDLSKADLHEANLTDADLTGAIIDGADFQGANLYGAKVAGLDLSKAKNLTAQQISGGGAIGSHIRKLAQVAKSSARLEASVDLDVEGERVVLRMYACQYKSHYAFGARFTHHQEHHTHGSGVDAPTYEKGMLNLANRWPGGKLRLDTITAQASKCPLGKAELLALATGAWCEAFGLAVPTSEELAQGEVAKKTRIQQMREEALAELRGGGAGVRKWNARDWEERRKMGKFRGIDFSGRKLAGAHLDGLDLQGATFDRAGLYRTNLGDTELQGASFRNADLRQADLAGVKAADANFDSARLGGCNLRAASFRRANFAGADLERADFSYSDLCGADLSTANLEGTVFDYAIFDDQTRWPSGFVPPDTMRWRGKGPRPGSAPPTQSAPAAGPVDFSGLVQFLTDTTDARLAKALRMLKADRFRLFADVKDDAVVGVVKSQTDKELVYSCRLAADGSFGCCTQNLKPCGGLGGALCKHLLVLLIGLAKSGQLDPGRARQWIEASRQRKPSLDKEAMGETFLRYKGAEGGEVDWRPTETVPEDYYTL